MPLSLGLYGNLLTPVKVAAAAAGVAMAGNGTVWLQSLLLSSMHWQRCLLHC